MTQGEPREISELVSARMLSKFVQALQQALRRGYGVVSLEIRAGRVCLVHDNRTYSADQPVDEE